MSNLEFFFDMGGYALFVWPSYILSALVLAALYIRSRQRLKSAERQLAVIDRRPARRGQTDNQSAKKEGHDT